MALNTCEMWSNGIKIAFFLKTLRKIAQRPSTESNNMSPNLSVLALLPKNAYFLLVGANLPHRLIPSLLLLIQPLDFIFYQILPALNIMMTADFLFLPKAAHLFINLLTFSSPVLKCSSRISLKITSLKHIETKVQISSDLVLNLKILGSNLNDAWGLRGFEYTWLRISRFPILWKQKIWVRILKMLGA